MSQQYKAAAAILKGAQASIEAILIHPEDEMHRLRLFNDLQRSHDQLLLLTGTGDLENQQGTVLGPAKTIGGRPIKNMPKITEADLTPSDDKVLQLKQRVESALEYFGPYANSEGILANIPDIVIRGVAKKAGLQVTKDEPKEITAEFIEEVKAALSKKSTSENNAPGNESGNETGSDNKGDGDETSLAEENTEKNNLPQVEPPKQEFKKNGNGKK